MHEWEEKQVVELLDPDRNSNGRRPLERTRSFVLAYATDDEIQRLTREGILVEQLQAQSTFAVSLKALSQSPA